MCVCCGFLDHVSEILRLERNSGRSEANVFLAEKMLERNNAGCFSEFISALKQAGKCFVYVWLVHS